MKIFKCVAALAMCVGCADASYEADYATGVETEMGLMSVSVRYDDTITKSQTDYVTALDSETKANKVTVMVFDKSTEALNACVEISSLSDNCEISLPVGEKTVYAVVNGPSLNSVSKVSDLKLLLDNLYAGSMEEVGLTLIGSKDCKVVAGESSVPVEVKVKWLVARVVLSKVTCNLPQQYGNMTLDCVYLGNAYVKQFFSGAVDQSLFTNSKGYASNGNPIGISGERGECESYLFRSISKAVNVGDSHAQKYHMYCQPNTTDKYTCIYLLTTIGGRQYYYRVPLDKGLESNTTCSVELKITNLGSPTPPDGDLQKGVIAATVSVDGWAAGNEYVAEF